MAPEVTEETFIQRGVKLAAGRFTADDFRVRVAPSADLMISCGCVPVDLAARKIAILHDSESGITQLPKGRKNIGEDLHAAALRETHEETGIAFAALPLKVATRATPTPDMMSQVTLDAEGRSEDVTTAIASCEPSAITHHRCSGTLAFKLCVWFAAQGDSTATPATDTREPWEQGLGVEWVDAQAASARMTFKADGEVVEKVLSDMRASGYDI